MTEKKIKIGILLGGRSSEHEVSLMSARSIIPMPIRRNSSDPIGIPRCREGVGENVIDRMLAAELTRPDAGRLLPEPAKARFSATNLRERKTARVSESLDLSSRATGTFGEDGTLQGFLSHQHRYVARGAASSSAWIKALFKT